MFEEEAEEYKDNTRIKDKNTYVGFPNERISELQDFEGNYIDISERIIKAFKDGAEFGYKKCQEEMQKNGLALQSDMDKTIEQNFALKALIEKMKCCGNCAKNGHICVAEEMQGKLCGKNKDKWELRRVNKWQ